MRRRVFIAINLPEDIKKELAGYGDKWLELPCRWTKPDNLHITLEFLGYVSDDDLLAVCNAAKDVASKHDAFEIKLNKIVYGPPKKMPYSRAELETGRSAESGDRPPRMVWVEGEASRELSALKEDLEKALADSVGHSPETRGFSPHITLGRIKTWEFKAIEPEERPDITEDINLNFEVNSIEVMESQLKRGGPSYAVLESYPLK